MRSASSGPESSSPPEVRSARSLRARGCEVTAVSSQSVCGVSDWSAHWLPAVSPEGRNGTVLGAPEAFLSREGHRRRANYLSEAGTYLSPLWRGARSNHEFGKKSKLMVPLSRWAGRIWVRPVCSKSGVQMQRRPQRAPRSISVALSSCASSFLTQLPQDTSGHQTCVGISTHQAVLQGSSWRSCDVTPF